MYGPGCTGLPVSSLTRVGSGPDPPGRGAEAGMRPAEVLLVVMAAIRFVRAEVSGQAGNWGKRCRPGDRWRMVRCSAGGSEAVVAARVQAADLRVAGQC